jgi:hypothetical protein
MKREEYGKMNLNYVMGGGSVSSNIKRMLITKPDINSIVLNKSSFINAIETIHALKEESIVTYKIDNDLNNEDVLFFCNNELIGECY